jgi:catechol 2,3-dioxygenase-like lactoylglutathione lyase family enzyme
MLTSLGRTTLLVRDYDAAFAFYRDQLGFRALHDETLANGQRYLHIGLEPQTGEPPVGLWLMRADAADDTLIGRQAGVHPFLVLYTSDCRATTARLRANGVTIRRDPETAGGATFSHIADLYGNELLVVQLPGAQA